MPVFTDKTTKDRLDELSLRAKAKGIAVLTRFLSPEEAAFAKAIGQKNNVFASFDGGYPDAERTRCCYHDAFSEPSFPIAIVSITWQEKHGKVGHRDLLGSILALGMDRVHIGDIVVSKGQAHAYATPEMARLIADSLRCAGNVSVCALLVDSVPDISTNEQSVLTDTVASLRLDNVLASGMRTSRSKAVAWVEAGKVSLNHFPVMQADKRIHQGDMISVRGFGRFRLEAIGQTSRKGHFPITLVVF